jgi:hypothetical protein
MQVAFPIGPLKESGVAGRNPHCAGIPAPAAGVYRGNLGTILASEETT